MLSFVTIILAFLCSEMSIFIVPVILVYNVVTSPQLKITNHKLKITLPYVLLTALYLTFYLLYVNLPGGSVYGRSFDFVTILKTLGKYILYPFVAGFDRNSTFGLVNLLLIARISLITLIGIFSLITKTLNKRLALFGGLWFLITVSIFTILGNHTFAYLDAIPAVGLTMIIASTWQSLSPKPLLPLLTLLALLTLSLASLITSQTTDPDLQWLNTHQQTSQNYLKNFKMPENRLVTLDRSDSDLMETTYFGYAIKAYYKNLRPTIILK